MRDIRAQLAREADELSTDSLAGSAWYEYGGLLVNLRNMEEDRRTHGARHHEAQDAGLPDHDGPRASPAIHTSQARGEETG